MWVPCCGTDRDLDHGRWLGKGSSAMFGSLGGKWCSFGRFWPGSSHVPDLQSQPELRGRMQWSCILDLQGRVGCCPLKNRGWFSKICPTHQDERFSGTDQVLVSHTVCMIRAVFFKLPERVEDFKTSQVHIDMIYSFFTGKTLHEWKTDILGSYGV